MSTSMQEAPSSAVSSGVGSRVVMKPRRDDCPRTSRASRRARVRAPRASASSTDTRGSSIGGQAGGEVRFETLENHCERLVVPGPEAEGTAERVEKGLTVESRTSRYGGCLPLWTELSQHLFEQGGLSRSLGRNNADGPSTTFLHAPQDALQATAQGRSRDEAPAGIAVRKRIDLEIESASGHGFGCLRSGSRRRAEAGMFGEGETVCHARDVVRRFPALFLPRRRCAPACGSAFRVRGKQVRVAEQ